LLVRTIISISNNSVKSVVLLLIVLVIASECKESSEIKTVVDKKYLASLDVLGALPARVKSPQDNLITAEKGKLGKLLFSEFLDVSIGTGGRGLGSRREFGATGDKNFVKRNSQTLLNIAYNGINTAKLYDPNKAPMFWDLRSESLENQALEPLKAFDEMKGENFHQDEILAEVVSRLDQIDEYKSLFAKAFPQSKAITEADLGKALAAFQRTSCYRCA